MRTIRILSLLFSLFQFLLVLKLIEYVRGDPIPNKFESISSPSESSVGMDRDSRQFFVATPNSKKKRKFKPWLMSSDTPTTDYPYNETDSFEAERSEPEEIKTDNSSKLDRIGVFDGNSTEADQNSPVSDDTARLCPGCVGQCGSASSTTFGFPAIEVFVALVVGVIWFIIFLYFWYYIIGSKPNGTAGSWSYGYGNSNGNSGWSPLSDSSVDDDKGSLWSLFTGLGQDGKSLHGFNQLTSLVTDSLFKLSNLYNNL